MEDFIFIEVMDEVTTLVEKGLINKPPATYGGEPVDDLVSEYWYNITMLVLLVYVSAFVTEFFIFWGFKKRWHHFSEIDISFFSQTIFPVPESTQSLKDKIKKHAWKILLAYRIVILLFCIFVWFWTLFTDTGGNIYDFSSFYTIWNFTMLITYFACAILLTVLDIAKKAHPSVVKILGNFTIIIYNIEIALVFLVDSVVWIILLPVLYQQGNVQVILTFSSSIVHGMNAIFMMIDFTFNRLPIRLFNMTWMVVWALVYIFWAMLYYTIKYQWRYPFLNLWTPYAMIWYGLVFSMHFVFYLCCYGLYKLKLKICRRVVANFEETMRTDTSIQDNSYDEFE